MKFIPEFVYALGYLKADHKKTIAAAGLVAVGGAALLFTGLPSFSSKLKSQDTWVVEQTLAETTVPAKVAPPYVKGDETRVVARYFMSGSQRKVWYLKKYPDAKKEALESAAKSSDHISWDVVKDAEKDALVRLPEAGSPWVPVTSDAGRKITTLPTAPGVENQPAVATAGD